MTSAEVRRRFLAFFAARGHAIIPSASLVPENDPSVLFNTAGMQPLVPYLLGEKHPNGTRLADFQKCVRTNDIDEVGDNTHLTFFEMMGNWSLGDYFKKEAIEWSYDLLTNKEYGFGLDPRRLYVSCFEGNDDAPRDEESAAIWRDIFAKNDVAGERIYFMPASENWWQPGPNGPCGPDSEMRYDLTGALASGMTKEEYIKADADQHIVEIWNDVFMEFVKKDNKVVGRLEKKNVDTGAGFERMCTVIQGKSNVFEADLFAPIMDLIRSRSSAYDLRSARIVADHMRTTTFLVADGVLPSNKDQGYVLRRLMRRAIFKLSSLGLDKSAGEEIIGMYVDMYSVAYPDLDKTAIRAVYRDEAEKFEKTLVDGKKELEKGTDPFILWTTYGFPIELTSELLKEKGRALDRSAFDKKMKEHQDVSRAGAEQKFKGGLGDANDPMVVRYHTATHLLHKALHEVLGEHVSQKGSNITPERLRFDFAHSAKMTDDEEKRVEDIVNDHISAALPVNRVELPKDEALKTGAYHFFGDKYGDVVSVYYIGDSLEGAYSKEFCGGPHVSNTRDLAGPEGKWRFKIQKEEAVSAGVRRIKAVLS
ncbi:MAG: alanine--tRNA ligase [Patescibacteria group bacterium]|nr:alanine--tRNA ligase [Patescibacteria group bacterium]